MPVKREMFRDLEIAEFDAKGNLVNGSPKGLGMLVKGSTLLGDKVKVGCVRFSQYPAHADSLFVSCVTKANVHQPTKVYEFDLDLTVLKNTYTGPSAHDSPPVIDFDPETGEMFMVAKFLNEPNSKLGNGDLVAFPLAAAGTNPSGVYSASTNPKGYKTLIDGDVFARRDDPHPYADPRPSGEPISRERVSI